MQASGEHFTSFFTRLRERYQRLSAFLYHDLWVLEAADFPSSVRWLIQPLQVVLIVLRGFIWEHQCPLRAYALTYTTLLALVPLLAFMFAFLKGLGVQNLIEPLLAEELSSVGLQEIVRLIFDFVNNVKVGTLSVVSLITLLFTTLWQLGTIEEALNVIWGVVGRTPLRKMTDYVSMIVLGPVVLTLAVTVNAALHNQALITTLLEIRLLGDAMALAFTLLSYIAVWFVFTFLYAFMPNTRVQIFPALVGGFVGSMLWQLAKWGYIAFQVNMANTQLAIYGIFAQLPVLMLWFYISWMVTLLGAEVTFACQNVSTYPLERFAASPSVYLREWLAVSLYFSLAQAFTTGTGPWSALAFAQQHRIPIRLLRELVATLVSGKLLVEAADAPEHYVPGRDPSTLTPWDILHALRHHGHLDVGLIEAQHALATALMGQVEAAGQQAAGACSITQWLAEKPLSPEQS
jgi:membrane protein